MPVIKICILDPTIPHLEIVLPACTSVGGCEDGMIY